MNPHVGGPFVGRRRRPGLRWVLAIVLVCSAVLVGVVLASRGTTRGVLQAGERAGDLNSASLPVSPGAVGDFSALVVNPTRAPVTLVGASLIAAPGRPLPRLVGVAIATTPSYDEPGRGWPNLDVPHRPFPGVLQPGRTWLIWAGSAAGLGRDYLALGLRVSYRSGGADHEVSVWGPGVLCVRPSTQHATDSRCNRDATLVLKTAEAKAG